MFIIVSCICLHIACFHVIMWMAAISCSFSWKNGPLQCISKIFQFGELTRTEVAQW